MEHLLCQLPSEPRMPAYEGGEENRLGTQIEDPSHKILSQLSGTAVDANADPGVASPLREERCPTPRESRSSEAIPSAIRAACERLKVRALFVWRSISGEAPRMKARPCAPAL